MKNPIDIEKFVDKFDGKDRARLVIKDFHERKVERKQGFLTSKEISALSRIHISAIEKDFDRCIRIYKQAPVLMTQMINVYMGFIHTFYTLGNLHFRLLLSKGILGIKYVMSDSLHQIESGMRGKNAECRHKNSLAAALKSSIEFLDIIQPIEYSEKYPLTPDALLLKDGIKLKETIAYLDKDAGDLRTMIDIANKMAQELEFDPFHIEKYSITYTLLMDNVLQYIKSHNNLIINEVAGSQAQTVNDNIKKYTIQEPKVDTSLYTELEKKIFGGNG